MAFEQDINSMFEESKKYAFEDPKRSFEIAKKAYEYAESVHMDVEKGFALFHMAYACRVMSDYSNGLTYAFSALEIMKENHNNYGIYKVRNIIGIIYFYYGDLTDALDHFMGALELQKNYCDPNIETSLLNNIGEVYREAGEIDKAMTYYKKALKIALENELEFNASAIYLNIGDILYIKGKYNASYQNLQKGYDLVLNHSRLLEQGEAETKLGRAKVIQGNYAEAKTWFLAALEKFNTINNKYYLVDLLIEMAALDIAQGFSPIRNLNEALDISLSKGIEKKATLIYKMISEYYEKKGDYKLAFDYFKSYHLKLGEVEASNLSKRLEILSIEFNFYKEKNENVKLKKLSEKLKRDINDTNKVLDKMKTTNKSLLKESLVDELTQLLNRRGVEKKFKEMFGATRELKGVVILMDIDHFKNYNDTWGHVEGDACLISIATALKSKPFKDYFVGRYGGEEFVAYLKLNTLEEARTACEKIRICIENLGIKATKSTDEVVTISIGAFFGTINNIEIKNNIKNADQQLYLAKSRGRNNVQITDRGILDEIE